MIMYALGPVLEKTEKKVERYVAVLNSDELSDDVKNREQLNELDICKIYGTAKWKQGGKILREVSRFPVV